jgi:hypothetical protein
MTQGWEFDLYRGAQLTRLPGHPVTDKKLRYKVAFPLAYEDVEILYKQREGGAEINTGQAVAILYSLVDPKGHISIRRSNGKPSSFRFDLIEAISVAQTEYGSVDAYLSDLWPEAWAEHRAAFALSE